MTKQERARTDLEQAVLSHLEIHRDQWRRFKNSAEFAYDGWPGLLLQHGRFFTPQRLPKGYRLMASGRCWWNAATLARRRHGLQYAEGVALSPEGLRAQHGWCVDSEGRVIDPTWREPGLVYFGVTAPPALLASTDSHNGILDDWMNGWPLLRARWPYGEEKQR